MTPSPTLKPDSAQKWDTRWTSLLPLIADWSEDPSSKYSALIIDPITQNIRSIGFNGLPRGIAFRAERHERPDKYNYFVHAEVNAIINAGGPGGGGILGTTMYLLKPPCAQCAGAIIQSGIVRIKYVTGHDVSSEKWRENATGWRASINDAVHMLTEARIELMQVGETG